MTWAEFMSARQYLAETFVGSIRRSARRREDHHAGELAALIRKESPDGTG